MSEQSGDFRNKVVCSNCGKIETRRHGLVPMGWQEMPDANRRKIALCPDCVRHALWLIEARLDVDPESGF